MQDLENNHRFRLFTETTKLRLKSKKILESIVRVSTNEKLFCNMSWDKNRYHKFEDNEYFFKTIHYLDLFCISTKKKN
jgi:hypothetical protein